MTDSDSGDDSLDASELHEREVSVEDTEQLLRAVRSRPTTDGPEYAIVDGVLRILPTAFKDANFKPSVDRAKLRTSSADTRISPDDGVTGFFATDVRSIRGPAACDHKGRVTSERRVTVLARSLAHNPSHAQIECFPSLTNTSQFRRIREALAILATLTGWIVPPETAEVGESLEPSGPSPA